MYHDKKKNRNKSRIFVIISKLAWYTLNILIFIMLTIGVFVYVGKITVVDQTTVVTVGIEIIALAISVWAGLNIANAIERKELEEVREKTDDIMQIIENVDDIKELSYNGFLHALMQTSKDEATNYCFSFFSENGIDRKQDYYELIKIENLFAQVYIMHTTLMHTDRELCEKAQMGLDTIKKIKSDDKKVSAYLSLREAEFCYYSGYASSVEESTYKDFFERAIVKYKEFCKKIGMPDPLLNQADGEYKNSRKSEKRLLIYMANTIGDTYRKILEFDLQHNDEKAMENDKPNAIKYCESAVEWANRYIAMCNIKEENLHYFEVYYRNYGVAMEKSDKCGKCFGKKAEEIIDNYHKAFLCIANSTEFREQRIKSVYHTLLSYLRRYCDDRVKKYLSEKVEDFFANAMDLQLNTQSNQEKNAAANNDNYPIKADDLVKKIKLMADVSEIAMHDMPRHSLPVVMNGFAYAYVVLLKNEKCVQIAEEFPEKEKNYIKKIKKDLSTLDVLLEKPDNYCKELTKRMRYLEDNKI